MMRRLLIYIIIAAAAFVVGRMSVGERVAPGRVTVLTRIDTMRVVQPEVHVVKALSELRAKLPLASDSTDSAEVEVPVTQHVYRTPQFEAYVSGYRPSLDSIMVFNRHVESVVTAPARPERFSVGLQAGYGFTPKGFQPYIGIGLSVRLLEF